MKKANTASYITVGKIGSPYGIRGWLKIHSYTEFGANILNYSPWYVAQEGEEWTTMEVEEGRPHGKSLIVKLAGIHTPEEARLFTNKLIAIDRSQLPTLKKNEYYWSDLEGLTVINKDGTVLGKVIYLIETGSNDVLVVKGDKEIAIPYLPGSVVLEIDLAKQEMRVDWELI